MLRPSKTVASPLVRKLVHFVEQHGLSPEDLMRRTGLNLSALASAGYRVGLRQYERLLELAAGHRPPIRRNESILSDMFMGIPTFVVGLLEAPTLRVAIERFQHYLPLISECESVRVRTAGDRLEIEHNLEWPRFGAFAAQVSFEPLIDLVRTFGLDREVSVSVQLDSRAGASSEDLEQKLGARVQHGTRNVLLLAGRALDAANSRANPELSRMAVAKLEDELAQLSSGESLASRVERTLLASLGSLHDGQQEKRLLEAVCQEFQMSRWTLRRSLAGESTSFEDLKLRVRCAESQRLLRDTGESVQGISERLGFASAGAFCRFFKRETGVTPLVFRKGGLTSPGAGRTVG